MRIPERRKSIRRFWVAFFLLSFGLIIQSVAYYMKVPKRAWKEPFEFYVEKKVAIFKLEGVIIKMIPFDDICGGRKK